MGLLDKAKAAASDLAAKADSALSSAAGGPKPADADRYFHDLGVLTYLEATGRPADAADRTRVMDGLQELDSAGGIRSFALYTAAPPAPGAAGAVPPPPGMADRVAPPPMPGAAATPPAPAEAAPAAPVTPPPPPSWATGGDAPT